MAGRNKSRGHVRFHTGQWYAVMPTAHAEDGRTSRPWYPANPNTEAEANELLARKLVEYDQQRLSGEAGWPSPIDKHRAC
jgi:hypothetical protein